MKKPKVPELENLIVEAGTDGHRTDGRTDTGHRTPKMNFPEEPGTPQITCFRIGILKIWESFWDPRLSGNYLGSDGPNLIMLLMPLFQCFLFFSFGRFDN